MPRKHRDSSYLTELIGVKVTVPAKLKAAYRQGPFYYQFISRGRSRIMRCDNEKELEWLAQKVANQDTIVVRQM